MRNLGAGTAGISRHHEPVTLLCETHQVQQRRLLPSGLTGCGSAVMMEICIAMIPIRVKLKGVKLGLLEAPSVQVEPASAGLIDELGAAAGQMARDLTVEAVAAMEPVVAVRSMFRAWGLDPSKYRPSSEALLRRVAQGKGLTHISNVVDIVNLAQIESGWPMGGYDIAQLHPPVTLRLGEAAEKYEGIGRRVWHLAGRPVLADEAGPFGSRSATRRAR